LTWLFLLSAFLYYSRYAEGLWPVSFWLRMHDPYIASSVRVIIILFWCFFVPFILMSQPRHFSRWIICSIAILLLIPAFYALLILHQMLSPPELIALMAIAWVADTGAYTIGRLIGRHKLAASISPGKTIEGAVAGVLLVIAYLLLLKHFCPTLIFLYSYVAIIKLGIIATGASILGDLFESWLKRVAAVKDSGRILPGHGGLLDRLDSLFAVVSVGYALLYNLL